MTFRNEPDLRERGGERVVFGSGAGMNCLYVRSTHTHKTTEWGPNCDGKVMATQYEIAGGHRQMLPFFHTDTK